MTEIAPEWVAELKKGSVQMLLLALLEEAPKYGFQIIRELREATNGFFDLKEGTLYPALRRLEAKGYLEGRWNTETEGGPRKYYHMTESGRNALKEAAKVWEELVWSSNQVLKKAE
ncbi:MAG: PadR family transcriptional regulator [Thermoplasmata archaeon]|nr:PadR family transcriptional regulator [Thermoplasmata archaeon]